VRLYFKENDLHILAKIRGVRSLRLQQVIRCKDGGFLEDRRDVLPVPDLRAKKMAGISRSFSIPEPYPNQLTDRHVPQTDKDQMGRRVEKGPPRRRRFCAPPPSRRQGKRCLPTDMRVFNYPTVPSCFGDLFAWKETRRRDKEGLGHPRPWLRLTATQLALPVSPPASRSPADLPPTPLARSQLRPPAGVPPPRCPTGPRRRRSASGINPRREMSPSRYLSLVYCTFLCD
jgi:hypothetical protein